MYAHTHTDTCTHTHTDARTHTQTHARTQTDRRTHTQTLELEILVGNTLYIEPNCCKTTTKTVTNTTTPQAISTQQQHNYMYVTPQVTRKIVHAM